MARIVTPDADVPNGGSNSDLRVLVTVPEEYMGFAIGQINQHDGVVKSMNWQNGFQAIQAALPAAAFDSLSNAILSFVSRGKVEYDP